MSADHNSVIKHIIEHHNTIAQYVKGLGEDEQHLFAQCLVFVASQISFVSEKRIVAMFEAAQKFGTHFLPISFYSTIPDTSKLKESVWNTRYDDIPHLGIDEHKIAAFIESLAQFRGELADVPLDFIPNAYYWNCVMFAGGDASLLYGIMRRYKPRRVIEVGCGFSTLMGLRALQLNRVGRYTCIEPFPNENIEQLAADGKIELIRQPVQDVGIDLFRALEANDILFIDSTHTVKLGSDAVHLILKAIPAVAPGVLVHLHDVFFPNEPPREWAMEKLIFWTEQYLLTAFMAFNDSFEMLVPNFACSPKGNELLNSVFAKAFPHTPIHGGASFWFQRVS